MSLKEESLKLDNQICFRLYKASRTMVRLYQPILESLRITYPQYITMLVLWEENTIDFKELGKRLDLKTGTLTPIIKKLEVLEYAIREKNNDDNRKVWVKLTPKGRGLKSKAFKIPKLLTQTIDMDFEQYLHYAAVLDELGDILTIAENKKKEFQ